jgi:very-short-patch-repair endonuclease
VVGRNARSRRGIAVHRVGSLEADERQILDGIPTTTPARTVLDLAAALDRDDLEHLLAEAQGRNRSTLDQLDTLIDRYPRRRGTRRLRSLLEQGDPARTRAYSERRLLALIRRAGLPAPETNTILHGHEVDFLWRRERVVVEVDGHAWHASRPARERDALRDQELVMRGYLVLRVPGFRSPGGPRRLWPASPRCSRNGAGRWIRRLSRRVRVAAGDLFPVDDVPERVDVVRATVLVLEVVGVLPDVDAQ